MHGKQKPAFLHLLWLLILKYKQLISSCSERHEIILLIKERPHLVIVNNFHSFSFPKPLNSPLSFTDWVVWTIGITLVNWQKNGAQINLFWNYDVFIFMEKTTKIYLLLHCYVYSINIFLSLLGFLSFLCYIWLHINASAYCTYKLVTYITTEI